VIIALATTLFLAVLPISAAPPAAAATAPAAAKPLPDWWGRINAGDPGNFPAPRPFQSNYVVSWEGIEAARFESQCRVAGDEISTTVKARTTGAARALWKFDATHVSVVNKRTLKPLHLEQTEDVRGAHTFDRVDFTPKVAIRTSVDPSKNGGPPKTQIRSYEFPGLYDMESAFLYMRSLPLAVGETRTVALMTSGSPYLATIKVQSHERVQVAAGDFPAYEYEVTLQKINKSGALEPRKGFKSARAWVSDDANRLIVKAEADVFIGSVTAELESLTFQDQPAR
jgi:hypothetical protein